MGNSHHRPPSGIVPTEFEADLCVTHPRCPPVACSELGDSGAAALASLLQACPNPDGSWTANQTLEQIILSGELLADSPVLE